jgi:hypothetical protein
MYNFIISIASGMISYLLLSNKLDEVIDLNINYLDSSDSSQSEDNQRNINYLDSSDSSQSEDNQGNDI